jgi:hypothetical protein
VTDVDVDIGGSSLTYRVEDDDPLTTLREQARALTEDLRIEVDRGYGFATASGGPPDADAGLLLHDSEADEDLRELSAREADLRLRRLLERAERAADRGEHLTALAALDNALDLNRTSAAAWLLRGRCLVAVGEFARAAQAVAVARRHARDRRERSLATTLAETVRRAELAVFLTGLDELLGAGRAWEAAERIQARLHDRPDDPVLLERLYAACWRRGGSTERARSRRTRCESSVVRVPISSRMSFATLPGSSANPACGRPAWPCAAATLRPRWPGWRSAPAPSATVRTSRQRARMPWNASGPGCGGAPCGDCGAGTPTPRPSTARASRSSWCGSSRRS